MESVIRDHIMDFFHSSYFSKNQYSFIKGRTTALQLLCVINEGPLNWTQELK